MNNGLNRNSIEKLLEDAAAAGVPELNPVDLARIMNPGLEEFDRQQRCRKSQEDSSRAASTMRRFFLRIAVAMVLVTASLLWLLCPSIPAQAESSIFKSVDGMTHAQVRALFPKFAALKDAPDELPKGSVAEKSEGGSSVWPSFEGFDVLSDSKLYDMTWWRPLDPEEKETGRNSPVVFTRSLNLRRNSKVPRVNELRIKFSTSGFAVDPVKIKPTDKVLMVPETELSYRNGKPERVFFLVTDVSDKPDNAVFTLVIHAVYWNGFNHGPVEDAATALATSGRGFDAELGVLLPHNHSIEKWALYRTPLVDGKFGDKLPVNLFMGGRPPREEPGILYWPIAEPMPSYRYTLEWTWATEGGKK